MCVCVCVCVCVCLVLARALCVTHTHTHTLIVARHGALKGNAGKLVADNFLLERRVALGDERVIIKK